MKELEIKWFANTHMQCNETEELENASLEAHLLLHAVGTVAAWIELRHQVHKRKHILLLFSGWVFRILYTNERGMDGMSTPDMN